MADITRPPMLDSTGQQILTLLQSVSLKSQVVDNLTTQDSTKALSANMGYELAGSSKRNIGELVFSSIPLSDYGLKLANGQHITRAMYADFYDLIVSLYNSGCAAVIAGTAADTGKYVYDSSASKVFLPNLNGLFIEGTNTASELGTYVAPGVPNITGITASPVGNTDARGLVSSSTKGQGAFDTVTTSGSNLWQLTSYSASNYYYYDKFDASKGETHNGSYSNQVYGKSDTVQPPAVKQYIYIVVATSIKPDYVDIDEMANEISTINGQIIDINSDITDLSNAISSISSHFDVGNAVFNSTSSTGLQTKQVNFNKTFSQIPTVIVCWGEPTAQNISAYCTHLQVASGSTTKTGFTAATYRSNAGGSWQFTYFAYEPF